jgi:hypothetical protein
MPKSYGKGAKGVKKARKKARRESGSMLSAAEKRALTKTQGSKKTAKQTARQLALKRLRRESGAAVTESEMKAYTKKKGGKRKR